MGRSGEETSALRSNGTPFGNRFKRRASTTLTDSELRDGAQCKDGFFDERYVADLKSIAAGSATEAEILHSLRFPLGKFNATDPGQPDWRQLARHLAQAEIPALDVSARRDDGEPDPPPPAFFEVIASEKSTRVSKSSITIRAIFKRYAKELRLIGKGRDAESRWAPVVDSLVPRNRPVLQIRGAT
jgi:hypothetical protein